MLVISSTVNYSALISYEALLEVLVLVPVNNNKKVNSSLNGCHKGKWEKMLERVYIVKEIVCVLCVCV